MRPGDLVVLALDLGAPMILTSQPGFVGESPGNHISGRLQCDQVCLVVAVHKQEVLVLSVDALGWQAARFFTDAVQITPSEG